MDNSCKSQLPFSAQILPQTCNPFCLEWWTYENGQKVITSIGNNCHSNLRSLKFIQQRCFSYYECMDSRIKRVLYRFRNEHTHAEIRVFFNWGVRDVLKKKQSLTQHESIICCQVTVTLKTHEDTLMKF